MAKNFYGVKKGKIVGVYDNWSDCFLQVAGYKGAIYKGFTWEKDAFRFVYDREMKDNESIHWEQKQEYKEMMRASIAPSSTRKRKRKRKKVKKINMIKDENLNKNVKIKDILDYLLKKFKENDFIVHYHTAKTGSVYIKLDYGVANSIRIANHDGYNYSYRYNVRLDISELHKEVTNDGLEMYFIPISRLDDLILKIQLTKKQKINKYGTHNYNNFMERNKTDNEKLFNTFKKYDI